MGAIAHEIAEQAAYRVFQLAGVAADEVSPTLREQAANQLASRLLMPSSSFTADVAQFGYDLIPLKCRYTTASYEAIAVRLLALPAALIVTVFDHGRLTSRRTNLPGRLLALGRQERICWGFVHEQGQPKRIDSGPRSIGGFPVHEENWKREILLTRLEPEFAELDESLLESLSVGAGTCGRMQLRFARHTMSCKSRLIRSIPTSHHARSRRIHRAGLFLPDLARADC